MVDATKIPLYERTDVFIVEESQSQVKFSCLKLMKFLGPGLLMSIAYMDPGNLEASVQVGAQTGYVLLWVLPLTIVLGFLVQLQAAKLGVVSGRHLAEHCKDAYPSVPRYILWIMAEIAIIGSDIQEVIGSAIAISLLSRGFIPLWAGVLITATDSFLLLFIERLGIRYLEAFFAALIAVMVAAFGVMYDRAHVPVGPVVHGLLVPSLPLAALPTAVALIGSLIMPHNIYLHSALVQTRRLDTPSKAHKAEAILYFGIESALGLVMAIFVNVFVVCVFAAGFFERQLEDIGLQNAGQYLGETYGTVATYIWALGLLAAGQSSTMTGTYTGQFLMTGYLDLSISPWLRITITRLVAIVPTLMIALMFESSNGLDQLNQALNLLQSVQLPFALLPLIRLVASTEVMGEFANGVVMQGVLWAVVAVLCGVNLGAMATVCYDAVSARPLLGVPLAVAAAVYVGFIGYLVVGPHRCSRLYSRCACSASSPAAAGVPGAEGSGAPGCRLHEAAMPLLEGGEGGEGAGAVACRQAA